MADFNLPYTGLQTAEYLAKARDFSGSPLGDGLYTAGKTFTAYDQYLNNSGALFKLNPTIALGYTVDLATYPLAKDDPNLIPYSNLESASTEAISAFNVKGTSAISAFNVKGTAAINALTYAVGFNIVGDFSSLPTISNSNEALSSKSVVGYEGYIWRTNQALPYTPSGSDPTQSPELGKWVAVAIGELESIARSLNVLDTDVIYSTDTASAIPEYIYDASQQKTYEAPTAAIGKFITSVVGNQLTTTEPVVYTLERPSLPATRVNIADFGTEADFLADSQPILQGLIDRLGSDTVIEFDPKYVYNFATNQNRKQPQLIAATFCIAIDGIRNVELIGNNSKITFSGDAAQDGHIFIASYTSDDSFNANKFTGNITVRGFLPYGNRPAGVTKWQTFLSVSSTDGCYLSDVHLQSGWDGGSSSIVNGDNTKKLTVRRCSGYGLSTPFDTASFEDLDIDDCVFDSLGSGNGSTGFNIFYAQFVYNVGRLQTPMRLGYGSGLRIGKRAVFRGFTNGARIEALANSDISGTFDSNGTNGILVTTSSTAAGLGYYTDGVYVEGAILSNNGANGVSIADSSDIKNIRITGNKIYDNLRGIVAGNQILNYYEGDNDFVSRGGAITQAQDGGKDSITFENGSSIEDPVMTVQSNSTNTGLSIVAKGTGKLSLGTNDTLKLNVSTSGISGETVTKYMEVYDGNNVLRKLAVVD